MHTALRTAKPQISGTLHGKDTTVRIPVFEKAHTNTIAIKHNETLVTQRFQEKYR
jgi:hypothetical protein